MLWIVALAFVLAVILGLAGWRPRILWVVAPLISYGSACAIAATGNGGDLTQYVGFLWAVFDLLGYGVALAAATGIRRVLLAKRMGRRSSPRVA